MARRIIKLVQATTNKTNMSASNSSSYNWFFAPLRKQKLDKKPRSVPNNRPAHVKEYYRHAHHLEAAMEIHEFGPPELLKLNTEAWRPDLGDSQVLVRVRAASLNNIDMLKRRGYGASLFTYMGEDHFPKVIGGRDFVGTIMAVGKDVENFKVGDHVWGVTPWTQGSWCTFIVSDADHLAIQPENLNFVEAASIPYVAVTVWTALMAQLHLTPETIRGKRVLVTAGSGGVGTFSIQLLKSWGCWVGTTVGSSKKVEKCRELGADEIVNYTKQDFVEILRDYDIVLDNVRMKDKTLQKPNERNLVRCLKPNTGKYVTLINPFMNIINQHGVEDGLQIAKNRLNEQKKWFKELGVNKFEWAVCLPRLGHECLSLMTKLVERGDIKPIVQKVFDFTEMIQSHKYFESESLSGKVIIEMKLKLLAKCNPRSNL